MSSNENEDLKFGRLLISNNFCRLKSCLFISNLCDGRTSGGSRGYSMILPWAPLNPPFLDLVKPIIFFTLRMILEPPFRSRLHQLFLRGGHFRTPFLKSCIRHWGLPMCNAFYVSITELSNSSDIVIYLISFQAIPFVLELRSVLDWACTDTTLSLYHWLKMDDIYANIYVLKCYRESEKVRKEKVCLNSSTQPQNCTVLCNRSVQQSGGLRGGHKMPE